MNRQQIDKVRAGAKHLLDLFIALREKYAMLLPLAFDEDLAERVGKGPRARGYLILRNSLLQSCVQDLVKLTLDTDPRTPSVRKLMETLKDSAVRELLLEDYAVAPIPVHVGVGDPLPAAVHAKMQAQERLRLTKEFSQAWSELSSQWQGLAESERLVGFKTWRDKLIAHAELHHVDGEYRPTDLFSLDLKWGDLGDLVRELQQIIANITVVTRSASFSWHMLDEQLAEASDGFWGLVAQDSDDCGAG